MNTPPIVPKVRVINNVNSSNDVNSTNANNYLRNRQIRWDLIPDLDVVSGITGYDGPAGATGITGYNIYRSEVSYADYERINSVIISPTAPYFNDAPPITSVAPFQWWYKVVGVQEVVVDGITGVTEGSLADAFPATDPDIEVFNVSPFLTTEPKSLSEQNITFPSDGRKYQTLPSTTVNPRWFLEIRKRHIWLLEMGGKTCWLIKRKYTGEHEQQDPTKPSLTTLPPGTTFDPLRWQRRIIATAETVDPTYGASFVNGYHTPFKMLVSFVSPGVRVSKIKMYGVEQEYETSNWALWEPNLLDKDIIVRPDNNERYEVQNVKRTNWRGLPLHQRFDLKLLEPTSIIYKIPIPQL